MSVHLNINFPKNVPIPTTLQNGGWQIPKSLKKSISTKENFLTQQRNLIFLQNTLILTLPNLFLLKMNNQHLTKVRMPNIFHFHNRILKLKQILPLIQHQKRHKNNRNILISLLSKKLQKMSYIFSNLSQRIQCRKFQSLVRCVQKKE